MEATTKTTTPDFRVFPDTALTLEEFKALLISRGVPESSIDVIDGTIIISDTELSRKNRIDFGYLPRVDRSIQIVFRNCSFLGAKRGYSFSFSWSHLSWSEFENCSFFNCSFFSTGLRMNKFINCTFSKSKFVSCDLMGSKFIDCSGLDDCVTLKCDVESAEGICLVNMDFNDSNIWGTISYNPELDMVYHKCDNGVHNEVKDKYADFIKRFEKLIDKANADDWGWGVRRFTTMMETVEAMRKIHRK